MDTLRKIGSIFIWPFLLGIGQFFVIIIITLLFQIGFQNDVATNFSLTGQALTDQVHLFMDTPFYKQDLADYIFSNSIVVAIFTFLLLFPIFYKRYKRNEMKAKKSNPYLFVFLLMFSLSIFLNILLFYFNQIWHVTNRYEEGTSIWWMVLLSSGIIGPILEEFAFRGLTYPKLKLWLNVPNAILFTSILFALFHSGITEIIYAFVVGIVLNVLYEHYKDIKIPIFGHMVLNITTTLTLSFWLSSSFFIHLCLCVLSLFIIFFLWYQKKLV